MVLRAVEEKVIRRLRGNYRGNLHFGTLHWFVHSTRLFDVNLGGVDAARLKKWEKEKVVITQLFLNYQFQRY